MFYSSVATVTIDPEQLIVAEGNDTMNSTRQLCVLLGGITSSIQREVTVNIAATKEIGTGITVTAVPAIADTLCFVR